MVKRKINMDIVNPNAVGIDIGSRSHFVAINQEHSDVKEFGVYAQDMKEWLSSNYHVILFKKFKVAVCIF